MSKEKTKEKRFYLTKQETADVWHYIGDPVNPRTTMDAGLVTVDRDEIRVDEYGAYVIRFIYDL